MLLTLEHLVPPDDIKGMSDKEIAPFKTDYDVMAGIEHLGHEAIALGVQGDIEPIRDALREHRPHVVFNLLEEFAGEVTYVSHVLGYLQLLEQAYTGCNPAGMLFSNSKALQRKILRFHRIPTPDFAIFRMGLKVRRPTRLEFPLIVKSLTEHGSVGISRASVVYDDEKLAERVRFVHEALGTDAIAEKFIEGRELYVGMLGNHRLETFPVWELRFKNLPEGAPLLATERVKWSREYQKRVGVVTGPAEGLGEELEAKIAHLCRRAYRALNQTGYARMDLRMDERGRVWIIESNPNPQLAFGEDFAESAEAAGLSYERLIQRILNLGIRAKRDWRLTG